MIEWVYCPVNRVGISLKWLRCCKWEITAEQSKRKRKVKSFFSCNWILWGLCKCGAGNRSLMKKWMVPTSFYLLVKYPKETVGDSRTMVLGRRILPTILIGQHQSPTRQFSEIIARPLQQIHRICPNSGLNVIFEDARQLGT